MFVLKQGTQVVAESQEPIEYNEQERAWLVISTETSWYLDNPKSWTVTEVADPEPQPEGSPNVIG